MVFEYVFKEYDMKKLIVFEEDEFKNKLLEFCDNFIKQQEKGYGVTLQSNETKKIIIDKNSICGSFLMVWNDTFKDT
jgi:hypothetical protein